MFKVISKVKQEIRRHKKVKNSILGNNHAWKTSHYKILADIINEELKESKILKGDKKYELGNSISPITLRRLFTDDFSETTANDLRFLKTLDKISIFLGFENFSEFFVHFEGERLRQNGISTDIFQEIIQENAKCIFNLMKHIPKTDIQFFKKNVILDSPYFFRFTCLLAALKEKKLNLLHFPASSYEVYGTEVVNTNDNMVVVKTQEFWNLFFRDERNDSRHYYVLNSQMYFLKKEAGEWKIWDNYNPNIWELKERI